MTEGLDTLIQAAAGGDQAAWRTIVERYSPRVFGLIRSQCGDAGLAEEITQSAFCTVATKLGRGGGGGGDEKGQYVEQGRFEPWLFRIAVNRLRDEMRRRKRQAIPVDPETLIAARADVAERADAAIERDERITLMREAMAQLPDADREILEYRHLAGMSYRQIAELLEEPLGTVLARQHRALKKLKTMLAEHVEP